MGVIHFLKFFKKYQIPQNILYVNNDVVDALDCWHCPNLILQCWVMIQFFI